MKIFLNPSCSHADIVKEAISDTVAEWGEGGLVIEAVRSFDEKKVKEVLNIPEDYTVVAVSPLGYADEEPAARPRKAFDEVVCFDRFK